MPKPKQIAGDFLYTLSGTVIYCAALQILVYPFISRTAGKDTLGNVLFFMAIVTIISESVGVAMNNVRLLGQRERTETNRDYLRVFALFGGVGSLVGVAVATSKLGVHPVLWAAFGGLVLLTTLRIYGAIEYRLNLNFKRLLIYNLFLTAGLCAGLFLFQRTSMWMWIFVLSEGAAIAFLACTGNIFKNDGVTEHRPTIIRSMFFYTPSRLSLCLVQNSDRLILLFLLSDVAVSEYYTLSLISKTLFLLVVPLNTLIVSYLTKAANRITSRQFGKILGITALFCAVFLGCSVAATPIFLHLFYPNYALPPIGLNLLVNAAGISGLGTSLLLSVVMTMFSQKIYFALEAGYAVVFIVCAALGTLCGGLTGFAAGALLANVIRFGAITIVGTRQPKGDHLS